MPDIKKENKSQNLYLFTAFPMGFSWTNVTSTETIYIINEQNMTGGYIAI